MLAVLDLDQPSAVWAIGVRDHKSVTKPEDISNKSLSEQLLNALK
jgi:hypothetical protein